MNHINYDVAFAPINGRLIKLSEQLGSILEKEGITSCILKTSIAGSELYGWNEQRTNINLPIVPIHPLYYESPSNFIKDTIRTIKSTNSLKSNFKLPFKLLIVFMDRYADGGILTSVAKANGIPTILFQEGFHARKNPYQISLYGLACWLRSKILSPWFGGREGYRATYAVVWSERGLKEDMLKLGRKHESIFVVGCPIPSVEIPKSLPPLNEPPVVMFSHQPFNPYFGTRSWNDLFYKEAIKSCFSNGYKVLFKPHPRFSSDKRYKNLKRKIEKIVVDNNGILDWANSKVASEEFLINCDALVTGNSVTAYTALRMGIPTFFIRTQYNRHPLLEELGAEEKIIYLYDWKELGSILNKILMNENNREFWFKNGLSVANILSGDDKFFKDNWLRTIKMILEKN